MGFNVSVNLSTGIVTWKTLDQNNLVLATGTAATLTAAGAAAITSLKASFTSQATQLTGFSTSL